MGKSERGREGERREERGTRRERKGKEGWWASEVEKGKSGWQRGVGDRSSDAGKQLAGRWRTLVDDGGNRENKSEGWQSFSNGRISETKCDLKWQKDRMYETRKVVSA